MKTGFAMEGDHFVDLSGEDPLVRILFFLFVVSVIAFGFYIVAKFGRKEEMYIHPALKRLLDVILRKR